MKSKKGYCNNCNELENENTDLKARLMILQKNFQAEKQEIIEELENTRNELSDKNEIVRKINFEKDSKSNGDQKLILDLQANNKSLQGQINNFLLNLVYLNGNPVSSLREAASLISMKITSANEIENENEKLRNQITQMEANLIEMQEFSKNIGRENKKLSKIINHLESIDSQKAPLEEVEKVIEIMKKKHNKKQNKLTAQFEEERASLLDRIAALENEKNILCNDLKKFENQEENSNKTNDDVVKVQEDLKAISLKNSSLIEQLTLSQDNVRTLEERLKQNECSKDSLLKKVDSQEQRIRDLEEENIILKENSSIADSELSEAQDKIVEIQTQNSELKLRILQLEKENKEKKAITEYKIDNKNEIRMQNEIASLKSHISSFEDLIHGQMNEISQLTEQRNALLNKMMVSDCLQVEMEKYSNTINEHNAEMKQSIVDLQEQVNRVIDEDNANFMESIEYVISIIPDELKSQLPDLRNESKSESLVTLIESLMKYFFHKLQENNEIINSSEYNMIVNQYHSVLYQLQNANKLLLRLAKSHIVTEENEITFLKQQCARIGRFIDDQNLSIPSIELIQHQSLFSVDEIPNPDHLVNMFLDFVSSDKLCESPFSELYLFILLVLNINHMLSSSIEEKTNRIADLTRRVNSSTYSDDQKDLQETINTLTTYMSQFVETPPSDFKELTTEFINITKDTLVSNEEKDIIDEENEVIKAENDSLREDMNKLTSNYKEQIKALKQLIKYQKIEHNEKTDEIISNYEAKIAEMSNQNNDDIQNFEDMRAQMDVSIQQLSTKLEHKKAKYHQVLQQIDENRNQIETLLLENSSLKHQYDDFVQEKSTMQNQYKIENQHLSLLLEKTKSSEQEYRDKLSISEDRVARILNEVENRSLNITKEYENEIQRLHDELEQLRSSINEANEQIASFENSKQELISKNAKLQASNRSLTIIIENLKEQNKNEKYNFEAKQSAFNIALQSKRVSLADENLQIIESCRRIMSSVLQTEFGISTGSDITTLDIGKELIARISERSVSNGYRIMQDAVSLRKSLGVKDSDSLVSVFQTLNDSVISSDKLIIEYESIIKSMKDDLLKLQRENRLLERNRTEINEWNNWAKSLFTHINDRSSSTTPIPEIRFLLEESLLASIGFRTYSRKIEMLRNEKRLLLTGKFSNRKNIKEKPNSIRPITLSLIFMRRIMGYGGCVPTQLSPISMKDRQNSKPIVSFE